MSRFVRPETRTLTLSNGDALTVRKRLTHGEQSAAYQRMYLAGVDGKLKVNPLQTGMALVTAYLLDWSLKDEEGIGVPAIKGKPLEEVEAALNAMAEESFLEIKGAIEAHEREMGAERAAGKQSGGEHKSSPTSPSPDGVTGDTSGSATSM